MKAYERLLSYVKVFTPSSEETGTSPSTQYQFDLARLLVQELKELGVEDADVDEHCYVYGHIPATPGYEDRTAIGYNAHMDTAPDYSGENVNPQIIENYDGNDIVLNAEKNIIMSPSVFPNLKQYIGQDLILTDGTTLLGGDDKASIAAVMTLLEYLVKHPEIKHNFISVAFTTLLILINNINTDNIVVITAVFFLFDV